MDEFITRPPEGQSLKKRTSPAATPVSPSGTPTHASGSGPSSKTRRSSASGTSGTHSENNDSKKVTDNADGACSEDTDQEEFEPETMPDKPDGDPACRTDLYVLPDAGPTEESASGYRPHGSAGDDASDPEPPLIVRGILRVGRMTANRDTFAIYENPNLRELLQLAGLPLDVVIDADKGAQFTVIDCDTHHWPDPPTAEELQAYAGAVHPRPDVIWRSHGDGLKFIFIGPHHEERAVLAAFSLPKSFRVEFLRHTRHPRSASSKHRGRTCGAVRFFANDIDARFQFRAGGRLTGDLRKEALNSLGLEDGGRYDHDRCPIDGDAESDAKGCVLVLDNGVFCHRCAGHGVCYAAHLSPGFYPFSAEVGGGVTQLELLGRERVHWNHARLELAHHYPHLPESLLRCAYSKVLASMWGAEDPRIALVFCRDLDFVWGDGVWLDAGTLQPTTLDNDAASGLPYVLEKAAGSKDEPLVFPNKVRRAQAKLRTPRGYMPVRLVRGISFADHEDHIPLPMPPAPQHPICLLSDPLPEAEAFRILEQFFPHLHRTYFTAALAAAICADATGGQPPMVTCSGPSGSGKEQHVRLAASFMGQDVVKLTLGDEEEVFARQIGVAVNSGNRFLMFDELSKTRDLAGKIKNIFMLSSSVQWRPLYLNRIVTTPVRSAFFFPCVRFPDFLKGSQEFVRRTRYVFLHCRVPEWMQTSGGDTAAWRDRTPENARVANSILTHIWRTARELGFHFFNSQTDRADASAAGSKPRSVADFLGLGTLADDEPGMDPELLRKLYRHARGQDGRRQLFEKDPTFVKGWVNLAAPAAVEIVSVFVPLDEADNLKHARHLARSNLEAQAWNDLLGIDSPPIKCVVKIHGNKWAVRFQSAAGTLKGQEVINEALPPIPGDKVASPETEPIAPEEPSTSFDGAEAAAAEALRKAGMPA